MMYKVIGGDGKEYGPIPVDKVQEWIREGRADGNSLILPPGHVKWRRLSEVPELQFSVPPNPGMYPLVYPPRRQTNTMAVVGLVLGLTSCVTCQLLSLVSLICSGIGLSQINRNPMEEGKGLAIAGLVISGLQIFFLITLFGLAIFGAGAK